MVNKGMLSSLNKGKNGKSMVITHEQGVIRIVLRLDSLEVILVIFHEFWS
jgi:hypothetical protein